MNIYIRGMWYIHVVTVYRKYVFHGVHFIINMRADGAGNTLHTYIILLTVSSLFFISNIKNCNR